ncbi:hypothetical protein JXM67_09830 [candidate division WOR-3 bacterium]|nr:hypothetical protein [candidate division WOR-3 bacterium]
MESRLLALILLLGGTLELSADENPALAELSMSAVGSTVAGATSWGGYLLWSWGSAAITPESWDATLETIGQVGLYGLGYGLFIPAGASTGVITVAIGAGDEHHSWGALLGAYVGSAASVPFAVMTIEKPTWGRISLAAASIVILPPLCSWAGYRLTPRKGRDETSSCSRLEPYFSYTSGEFRAGVTLRF